MGIVRDALAYPHLILIIGFGVLISVWYTPLLLFLLQAPPVDGLLETFPYYWQPLFALPQHWLILLSLTLGAGAVFVGVYDAGPFDSVAKFVLRVVPSDRVARWADTLEETEDDPLDIGDLDSDYARWTMWLEGRDVKKIKDWEFFQKALYGYLHAFLLLGGVLWVLAAFRAWCRGYALGWGPSFLVSLGLVAAYLAVAMAWLFHAAAYRALRLEMYAHFRDELGRPPLGV